MSEGVDYSTARPDPAGLYAAGKRFAVRYGGAGTSDKWLTVGEAKLLTAMGLSIVANVEGTARGLLGGSSIGAQWARNADAHFRACGMPAGRPIYLSADWDVQASEWATVTAALRGAADEIGPHRVGIYGGRRAIEWAQRDGVASWFWQTYAWSGSPTVWVPGVHIRQYRNGVTVAGGECDLDRSLTVDYGQWKVGGDPMNLGYSDLDGQYLCERVSSLLHMKRADMGPETGQDFEVVQLLRRVDANTSRQASVTLSDAQMQQLATLLEPMLERAVENVLARTDVVVRPSI